MIETIKKAYKFSGYLKIILMSIDQLTLLALAYSILIYIIDKDSPLGGCFPSDNLRILPL